MTVRDTSIEALNKIKANGLLSERRLQVYEILFERGPLAGAQVSYLYQQRHGKTARSETVRNRLTELRDLGVVAEVGHVEDPNTKMRVIQWDVTSRLPQKIAKRETKTEIIARQARRIVELEGRVRELEAVSA